MDLQAYAARIGYAGGLAPDLETLRGLHLAHATHIPFENLDILLGRPIRLDPESVWRKLVEGRRGGYCFEQNALFAAVLEAIGFRVVRLAARVRMGGSGVRPRLHMLLLVEVARERWLADVGFGGDGPLVPVAIDSQTPAPQFAWIYRVVPEGAAFVLQSESAAGWLDLYSFTLEEQHPADYELGNYYTSTHPDSPFVKTLTVQQPRPDRRLMLVNRKLTERTPGAASEILLPDDEALLAALSRRFGLEFPDGTRFAFRET